MTGSGADTTHWPRGSPAGRLARNQAHEGYGTMDRYGPRLIRGVAAASVSIFLVAGAAFAANAVMGPPSVGPDFAPAAAVRSPLGASKVAEPTETAEPTEVAEPTGAARPARAAETAETAETAEPSETPDAQDQSGDHDDGDQATSTSGATPEPTNRPEPAETNQGGGHGDGGSSHGQGGSDQGGNG